MPQVRLVGGQIAPPPQAVGIEEATVEGWQPVPLLVHQVGAHHVVQANDLVTGIVFQQQGELVEALAEPPDCHGAHPARCGPQLFQRCQGNVRVLGKEGQFIVTGAIGPESTQADIESGRDGLIALLSVGGVESGQPELVQFLVQFGHCLVKGEMEGDLVGQRAVGQPEQQRPLTQARGERAKRTGLARREAGTEKGEGLACLHRIHVHGPGAGGQRVAVPGGD